MILIFLLIFTFLVLSIMQLLEQGTEDPENLGGVCPGCGGPVELDWLICPRCKELLQVTCDGCDQQIPVFHRYCTGCGASRPLGFEGLTHDQPV